MTTFATRRAPFGSALLELAQRRDDIVVLTADLAKWTDLLPFAEAHPDRFIQLGMAEQNLIGVAAGLAKAGLYPIAVTYGVFASRRAYDQIAMALSTRPCQALVVGFLPGVTSRFRATHQALDDVALMRAIPGMTVLDPADADELAGALHAAVDNPGVTYLRARRGLVEECLPESLGFEIGPARELRSGPDIGIVATGFATVWALEALDRLQSAGVDPGFLHVPTIKPLDEDTLLTFAARYDTVVVIENHSTVGGLGESVASALGRAGAGTRVVLHGVPDRWGEYGTVDYIRKVLRFDPDGIAGMVTGAMAATEEIR